jgi:hypothetical protein
MAEPLARAAFDTTAEERTDVAVRVAELLPSVRRQRHLTVAITLGVAAVVVFALMRWTSPDSAWPVQAGCAAAATAVVGLFTPRSFRRAHRKLIHRTMVDAYGGDGPMPFAVELHPDGLVADCRDHRISLPWRAVHTVRQDGDDIEIRSRTVLVIVRARAFATPAARATFFDLCQSLASGGTRSVTST